MTKLSHCLLGGCTIFNWIRILSGLVLCSFCYPGGVVAQTPTVLLSIKPGLCVLGKDETECRDQLRVKWKANLIYSLCLYQEKNPHSLHCWQSSKEGEYQFGFVASENTRFELRDSQTQQTLAVKTFKILTDHNNTHHRRRNPWSFF
jgi:Protein of unknown function (DUF3019)